MFSATFVIVGEKGVTLEFEKMKDMSDDLVEELGYRFHLFPSTFSPLLSFCTYFSSF